MTPFQQRRAVWMEGAEVRLIDQRLLPHRHAVVRSTSARQTALLIREMAVRGAGTLGVTAGLAIAQAALKASSGRFWKEVDSACEQIRATRPTARNLFGAVERVVAAMRKARGIDDARQRAVSQARAIEEDALRMTEAMARRGLPIVPDGKAVLTHCNAGWLAYPGWGTALAPIYLAHERGQNVFVLATETRPRSQGAKLTSWELTRAGIPHALLSDTAAGAMMAKGEVGVVIVGADRVAANGDTANKIGTYSLAVLAKAHGIPFYVAAPSPTFDADCPSGSSIPIEERDEKEVLEVNGMARGKGPIAVRIAPEGVRARNPAFDVTPSYLITRFLTECGLIPATSNAITRFLSKARGPHP